MACDFPISGVSRVDTPISQFSVPVFIAPSPKKRAALADKTENLQKTLNSYFNYYKLWKEKQRLASDGRRKVFKDVQLAPSSSRENVPSIEEVTFLKNDIRHHAYLRVQLFAVAALALWKKGVRSSGESVGVDVRVGGALAQVGQSSVQDFHAAHAHTASGFRDNRKELLILEIAKEEKVTPKKKMLLKSKGMEEAELQQLIASKGDIQLVRKVIQSFWPEATLIEGTHLELTLNATTTLPKDLNLLCDGNLEKMIRPLVGELFLKVMHGEIDPISATKEYVAAIKAHFEKEIYEHSVFLEECIEKGIPDPYNKLERLKKLIYYNRVELHGTEEPEDYEAIFGSFKANRKVKRLSFSAFEAQTYEMLMPRKPVSANSLKPLPRLALRLPR